MSDIKKLYGYYMYTKYDLILKSDGLKVAREFWATLEPEVQKEVDGNIAIYGDKVPAQEPKKRGFWSKIVFLHL